jgi:iron complex transport system permease protein
VTVTVERLPGRTAVRLGAGSVVVRPRALLVTGVLVALAAVVGGIAVSVGSYVVPLPEVLAALTGRGDQRSVLVVQTLRLPRILVGLLVGAAFGLSGALTQSVARNPLASPDVVGVTAGASAAAVAVLVLGLPLSLPLAAMAGGLGAAALVGVLAWRDGVTGPRLVLVGVGVSYVGWSLTSYLLVRGDLTDAQRATVWLAGSLNGRGWEHVRPVAVAVAVLVPLALVLGRSLASLRLGDDLARGLGLRVNATRVGLVVVAVVLASVATASAGPVVFVALVAPQIALRLTGGPGLPLAASAATGAVLVVAADLVARTALPGTQLPVGAVTAVVGAPVLLWLLRRSARGRTA